MLKAIKRIYLFAAIYGVLLLAPMYFMESKTGIDSPPAITHPEFYYGFIGVALAAQVMFFIISRDPIRYKPLMIAAILEKVSFGAAAIVLLSQNRIPMNMFFGGCIDLFLMSLFIFSYLKTPDYKAENSFENSAEPQLQESF
ncbi:MAG: hypothetical protein V4642_06990 [Bacteroidota bacterium]